MEMTPFGFLSRVFFGKPGSGAVTREFLRTKKKYEESVAKNLSDWGGRLAVLKRDLRKVPKTSEKHAFLENAIQELLSERENLINVRLPQLKLEVDYGEWQLQQGDFEEGLRKMNDTYTEALARFAS